MSNYKAVPLDILYTSHLNPHRLDANSDLDALVQMKQHFGSGVPFVLWEGKRKVLIYQPVANQMGQAPKGEAACRRP